MWQDFYTEWFLCPKQPLNHATPNIATSKEQSRSPHRTNRANRVQPTNAATLEIPGKAQPERIHYGVCSEINQVVEALAIMCPKDLFIICLPTHGSPASSVSAAHTILQQLALASQAIPVASPTTICALLQVPHQHLALLQAQRLLGSLQLATRPRSHTQSYNN